jgi:3-oxoacyl-[acyl-carrier-protein] synthase-3
MNAAIRAIAYHFPERRVSNADLASVYPDWQVEKIQAKTGIESRRVAEENECASDLAVGAAERLFAEGSCPRDEVDFVLFCTQSPDYFLPTTACLLQDRLGLSTHCGALDFNLGCSGYIYGLGLAKGLIETGQARKVLLLTGDTYTKFVQPGDRNVQTIFGDAAAATLVVGEDAKDARPSIGPFVYGTDGKGGPNLIVGTGGMRQRESAGAKVPTGERSHDHLFMNGPEIFTFTLNTVPPMLTELLAKSQHTMDDIDLFFFHQANKFMLEHLRKKLGVPESKFIYCLADCGNTVSSTIPIALRDASDRGILRPGQLVMAVGFGVGYSWGATLIRWAI